jgi:DNA-binding transcriptional LysR family regulator
MPKVHVKLHDWSNEENVAGLRDGRLSLAFVVRPPKAVLLEGIRFEELIRERICLAVPPHHAFATRRSVSLTDAASEPFIGLTREEYPDYYDYLSVTFSKVKQKPRVVEEHDSVSVISRSRYWDRYRSGSVRLQFRKPCEALASYSRAETNLNRHRRAKEPT